MNALWYIYLNSMHVAVVIAAPLEGPVVVDGKPGRNEAELIWREIPQHSQRGFITNYTISYTSGTDIHSMYPKQASVCAFKFLYLVSLEGRYCPYSNSQSYLLISVLTICRRNSAS